MGNNDLTVKRTDSLERRGKEEKKEERKTKSIQDFSRLLANVSINSINLTRMN